MSFDLFPFQLKAVQEMADSIALWVKTADDRGRPPITVDGEPIPLFSHLTAITGAGKTPILASVIGKVGPAIVLWTTNRSVVVDQTVEKLGTNYRHFLPEKTVIISEKPTKDEWASLMDDEEGVVIWCLTVASWNDTDDQTRGTADARLNIHRPAPDWAGERSPWDQLGDLDARKRPLWIVYDESQGQTDVQLDQLLDLDPLGILAASGTPVFSARIDGLRETLAKSDVWGPIAAKAMVEVPTSEVAKAGLLKSTIEMTDLNTDDENKVREAVLQLAVVEDTAAENGVFLNPRAIYVVEESDRRSGEPRPVTLWKTLTERCGVRAEHIAVATSTRELPTDAERVTDLSQLRPRHRHVIFNKKFQEGWDDPAVYVAYFDGETRSAIRIRQIIGRVIRQPNAAHFEGIPKLNTAYLFVSSPDAKFASIVEAIRRNLAEEYGCDENGEANVRLRQRSERPAVVPLRAGLPNLSLPVLVISASRLEDLYAPMISQGLRPFPDADLDAPGQAVTLSFALTDTEKHLLTQIRNTGQNIRSLNGDYFRDRVRAMSREAFDHLPETALEGPTFAQHAAALSRAQEELRKLATEYVSGFEERVRYEQEADPKRDIWRPKALEPVQPATLGFTRSVHGFYPDVPSFLNNDERPMAQALDTAGVGWWMRNPPTRAMGGYGIPLPVQVAGSQTFFPDFLWWVDGNCYAIDTTGIHILDAKVRGKLLNLAELQLVLVTRGRVAPTFDTLENRDGWTLVRRGPAGPQRTHFDQLGTLLEAMRNIAPGE
jgi:type III restriction enzyme